MRPQLACCIPAKQASAFLGDLRVYVTWLRASNPFIDSLDIFVLFKS